MSTIRDRADLDAQVKDIAITAMLTFQLRARELEQLLRAHDVALPPWHPLDELIAELHKATGHPRP